MAESVFGCYEVELKAESAVAGSIKVGLAIS